MTVTSEHMRAARPQAHQEAAEFQATFLEHYTRVYMLIFRLLGDKAEAEDLALEAFWKLWQHPPLRTTNLGGWLYRVATHLGYNSLRARKRRERYELQSARQAWENAAPADPAREAEREEEHAAVRAALARVSEREAQLLMLRHSGLSYREIAAALSVSPNSVGTLLARAEEAFERVFQKGGYDAPRR